MLPTDAQSRKNIPVYSGFIKYFPDAICEVARLSKIGNDQHNPGQPLHWAKEKSSDELDALMRHLIDDASGVPVDTDGIDHAVKVAWRAMANLQRLLDARNQQKEISDVRITAPGYPPLLQVTPSIERFEEQQYQDGDLLAVRHPMSRRGLPPVASTDPADRLYE